VTHDGGPEEEQSDAGGRWRRGEAEEVVEEEEKVGVGGERDEGGEVAVGREEVLEGERERHRESGGEEGGEGGEGGGGHGVKGDDLGVAA